MQESHGRRTRVLVYIGETARSGFARHLLPALRELLLAALLFAEGEHRVQSVEAEGCYDSVVADNREGNGQHFSFFPLATRTRTPQHHATTRTHTVNFCGHEHYVASAVHVVPRHPTLLSHRAPGVPGTVLLPEGTARNVQTREPSRWPAHGSMTSRPRFVRLTPSI